LNPVYGDVLCELPSTIRLFEGKEEAADISSEQTHNFGDHKPTPKEHLPVGCWNNLESKLGGLSPQPEFCAFQTGFLVPVKDALVVGFCQVRGTRPFHDYLYEYDVTPDGQHFLFNLSREGTVSPLTVVVNWNSTPN
jgi:hypothetical protein